MNRISYRLSLCVLCVFAVNLFAASPDVGVILPRGGQRGTEVVLNFQGARLADAKEVLAYGPGFEFQKLEVVNPGHVKVTAKIAADCPLGEHALRLRCASGTSYLRTFWVGALPCLDEKEPNNEFAKPQEIPLNQTVHGVIQPEDVDYFQVEAKKGQRLSVEIEGMRLGTAFFDPAIAILNSKRFELAASDDTPLCGQDGFCSIIVPEDGKYTIRVRETSYGGSAASHYRLHVGTFPRPTAVFPTGGKPGEEVEVTFLGDPSGPAKRKIKLPNPAPDEKFGVRLEDAGGISPTAIPLRVVDLPSVNEVEPNDGPAQATVVPVPGAFHGMIGKLRDHDHFKFAGKKGQVLDIRCYGRRMGSPLDPSMWILDPGGRMLASADDSEQSADPYIRFTVPDDKEYTIGVRDHLYKGGPLFTYRVEIRHVEPKATVQLTKYGQPETQERQTIDVPQGNRFAVLARVVRTDFGGEVELVASGMPEKLAFSGGKVGPGMGKFPVVFEAAGDAPVAGKFGALAPKPTDANSKTTCRYLQRSEMVYGPNNANYIHVDVDKLALAVTEPVPFTIRIIEPKTALVRSGTMQLKVIADRRDGHKAPISLQPLDNPPGVAATNVTIPEGQNEATMTLTANGGAAVGKWDYVVMANAAVASGPVWVSSQIAKLEIAPPPFTVSFDRVAAEQGQATSFHAKVNVSTPFTGPAKLQMVGLPNKVTATEVEIQAGAKEVTIPLKLDPASPAGQHKNLICQVSMSQNGEPVVFAAGVGELRIDKPLPPKASAKAAAQPKAAPKAAETKRLTRLEQLRKEQEEREKGGKP